MISLSEFQQRQRRLLDACEPNSVVVVAGATQLTRSRDTEYPFRQHSDFTYLTGFNEADAWLLLSNHERHQGHFVALACQGKDPTAEIWHGRRLGPEAALERFDLDEAYDVEDINSVLLEWLDGHNHVYFAQGEYDYADEAVLTTLQHLRDTARQHQAPVAIIDYRPVLHEMRLIKSEAELALMQRAGDISAQAHCNAMKFAYPGCYEYQLAAQIECEFAMQGALHPAYATIVGSGDNGCILHYTENNKQVRDGELILIDAGAEYYGYAADITRTFPANGKFSVEQAQLYNLVLAAQEAALQMLLPGNTLAQAMEASVRVITAGLVQYGVLSGDVGSNLAGKHWQKYFMHGLGHYLGLDVHDVGAYKHNGQPRELLPGMVLTVEPGIYISQSAPVPDAFKGIGIRIEDNIVITSQGHRVLTTAVPKTIAEIEALMETNGQ
jgi:Xaa-Pro aminopeptidase